MWKVCYGTSWVFRKFSKLSEFAWALNGRKSTAIRWEKQPKKDDLKHNWISNQKFLAGSMQGDIPASPPIFENISTEHWIPTIQPVFFERNNKVFDLQPPTQHISLKKCNRTSQASPPILHIAGVWMNLGWRMVAIQQVFQGSNFDKTGSINEKNHH